MKADLSYRKLLLSTMHIVIAEPSDHAVISDQSLAAAMTVSSKTSMVKSGNLSLK